MKKFIFLIITLYIILSKEKNIEEKIINTLKEQIIQKNIINFNEKEIKKIITEILIQTKTPCNACVNSLIKVSQYLTENEREIIKGKRKKKKLKKKVFQDQCKLVIPEYEEQCKIFVLFSIPSLIQIIKNSISSPRIICQEIGLCNLRVI
jgi:hypothetical protein